MPALVLLLWLLATLGWWAFAFMPLPAHPPAWLAVARVACFGTMDTGLPDAAGSMLLVLAPASFLVAIVVLWGRDLVVSLGRVMRSHVGQVTLVVLLSLTVLEGGWVASKVRAARAIASWDAPDATEPAALPAEYPRRHDAAPDFLLTDQQGAAVSLGSLRGRPVVISFVFAHCQTLCPLVVETLKSAGAESVLLVTLDPWRDTVGSLPGFAHAWKLPEGFHVLSSARPDDVLAVIKAYGVPFERDPRSGDIMHPGLVFVVDRDGQIAFTFNTPSAAWVREAVARLG